MIAERIHLNHTNFHHNLTAQASVPDSVAKIASPADIELPGPEGRMQARAAGGRVGPSAATAVLKGPGAGAKDIWNDDEIEKEGESIDTD